MSRYKNKGKYGLLLLGAVALIGLLIFPDLALANPPLSNRLSSVKSAWKSVLGVVDIITSLALIFIAIVNILHINIEAFDVKRLLPSLIVGVIMANFSWLFCSKILDLSSALFGILTPPDLAGALSEQFGKFGLTVDGLSGMAILVGITSNSWPITMWAIFAMVFMALLPMIPLLLFALILWGRQILVLTLVAASPIAFISYFVPFGKGLASQWFNWFLKWVFLAPVGVFFVYILTQLDITNPMLSWVFTIGLLTLAVYIPFVMGREVLGPLWNLTGAKATQWGLEKAGKKYDHAKSWADEKAAEAPVVGGAYRKIREAGTEAEATHMARVEKRETEMEEIAKTAKEEKIQKDFFKKTNGGKDRSALNKGLSNKEGWALAWKDLDQNKGGSMAENMTIEQLKGMALTTEEENKGVKYKRDEEGNIRKDAQGNSIVDSEIDQQTLAFSEFAKQALETLGADSRFGAKHERAKEELKQIKREDRKDFADAPIDTNTYVAPIYPPVYVGGETGEGGGSGGSGGSSSGGGPSSGGGEGGGGTGGPPENPRSTYSGLGSETHDKLEEAANLEIEPEINTREAENAFNSWLETINRRDNELEANVKATFEGVKNNPGDIIRDSGKLLKKVRGRNPSPKTIGKAEDHLNKITGAQIEGRNVEEIRTELKDVQRTAGAVQTIQKARSTGVNPTVSVNEKNTVKVAKGMSKARPTLINLSRNIKNKGRKKFKKEFRDSGGAQGPIGAKINASIKKLNKTVTGQEPKDLNQSQIENVINVLDPDKSNIDLQSTDPNIPSSEVIKIIEKANKS